MLRMKQDQLSLWDSILPENVRALPDELQRISGILDDPRFFEPYRKQFQTRTGRPTVPVDVYHRLMYLKFRYNLGYETLVKEVSDSISWRIFCHIPLDGQVPHSTTLMKLTRKYGSDIVDEVNRLILEKARQEKLLKGKKLRVDTTVIESDIQHPTDAGLLADGIKVISRLVKRAKESGAAVATQFRDRTRTVRKHMLEIGKCLRARSRKTFEQIDRITESLVETAEQVLKQAQVVVEELKDTGDSARSRMADKLNHVVQVTQTVVGQCQQVVSGNRRIPDRIISIFDTDARPIRKGKLKQPTEFGEKVVIADTDDRFITHYEVHKGNPPDESLLLPALQGHADKMGRVPWELATDRGFYSKANEERCREVGIHHVSLPYRGKKSKKRQEHERQSEMDPDVKTRI